MPFFDAALAAAGGRSEVDSPPTPCVGCNFASCALAAAALATQALLRLSLPFADSVSETSALASDIVVGVRGTAQRLGLDTATR